MFKVPDAYLNSGTVQGLLTDLRGAGNDERENEVLREAGGSAYAYQDRDEKPYPYRPEEKVKGNKAGYNPGPLPSQAEIDRVLAAIAAAAAVVDGRLPQGLGSSTVGTIPFKQER